MKKNIKQSNEKGFTIIEVLIVLAIAALILLVVFLAVPGLQRAQRNNGRTSEATRLATAITNFIGNNQGNLPGYTGTTPAYSIAQAVTDESQILNDWGITNSKYFNNLAANTLSVAGTPTAATGIVAGKITIMDLPSGNTTGATTTSDGVLIVDQGLCGSPSSTAVVSHGTANKVALLYTTETTGTNYSQLCIQVQ
jgi:prepilin-type N-terminal cleavage/methylation domain-containing protein